MIKHRNAILERLSLLHRPVPAAVDAGPADASADGELVGSSALARRSFLLGAPVAAVTLASTGCFAAFPLTTALWSWNDSFKSKWVDWVIFLVFGVILPAYAITAFVDILVLNAVMFWSGKNPIPRKTAKVDANTELVVEETEHPDTLRVALLRKGEVRREWYLEKKDDEKLIVRDGKRRKIVEVRANVQGASLVDEQDQELASLSREDIDRVKLRFVQGDSPTEAVLDELEATGQFGAALSYAESRGWHAI
jgi:hypothetical protein